MNKRTTCIKGQNWHPSKMVPLCNFIALLMQVDKIKSDKGECDHI